jgi:putative hydrolase of the HAD superfamily
MRVRAVFFDLDDTLCNFRESFQVGVDHAFTKILRHYPHLDRESLDQAWRESWRVLAQELEQTGAKVVDARNRRFPLTFAALGFEDAELAQEVDRELGEEMLRAMSLFEDVGVLDALRPLYKLAIVTNGAVDEHSDSQWSKAVRLGLIEKVDAFIASDSAGARKPNPAIFQKAAEHLSVLPGEVVFVGDSVANDVVGANKAGMWSVLLLRHPNPVSSLEGDQLPHFAISTLAHLPRLLERLDARGA